MLVNKSELYDFWYEDENGLKYFNQSELNLDFTKHKYTYHQMVPNIITEKVYEFGENGMVLQDTKYKNWNINLVLAMFASGDYKLDEAIKVVAKSCERCLNVLHAKYLNKKIFYKNYKLENWEDKCNFCQLSDDKYFD